MMIDHDLENDKNEVTNYQDIDFLENEKQKIQNSLIQSGSLLNEIDVKRRKLKAVIRNKIMRSKIEEIEKEKEFSKKINQELSKAKSLFRNGYYEQTIKECDLILQEDESNKEALSLIKEANDKLEFIKKEEIINEELSKKRELERKDKIKRLRKYFREARYEEAIAVAEDIINNYGVSSDIQEVMRICETNIIKNHDKRLRLQDEEEKKRIEVNKYMFLAKQCFLFRDFSNAILNYQKVLEIDSTNNEARDAIISVRKAKEEMQDYEIQKHKEKRDKIAKAHIISQRLINEENYLEAIKVLEGIISISSESEMDAIYQTINQLREEYNNTKKQKEEEYLEFKRIDKEKKRQKEKNYLEQIYKFENLYTQQNYQDAYLLLKKLLVEYPEKSELRLKMDNVRLIIEEINEEERMASKKATDEKEYVKSLLGEAESLFYIGDFEKSINNCLKVIKINKFDVEIARDLLKKIEEKKSEQSSIKIKEEALKLQKIKLKSLEIFNEYECEFRKNILQSEFQRARILFEDLKLQANINTDLKKRLYELEDLLIDAEKKLEEEKLSLREKFTSVFNKALSLYQTGEYWEAYTEFKHASILHPLDEDSKRFKEKALKKIQQAELKQEQYTKNKHQFEKDFDKVKVKVVRLIQENNIEDAIHEFEKLGLRYPGQKDIIKEIEHLHARLETKKLEDRSSELRLQEHKEVQRKSLINELIIKGQFELKQNNFTKSLGFYFEALHLSPSNKDVLNLIEEAKALQIQYERKIEEEKIFLKEEKRKIQTLIFKGDKSLRVGDIESALEFYENAVELDISDEQLKTKIYELATKLKEKNEKIKLIKEKIQSKVNEWSLEASKCFFNKKYGEALSICEKILLNTPENPEINDLKKQIIENKKQSDKYEKEKMTKELERIRIEKEKSEIAQENQMSEIRSIHHAGLEFYRNNEFERAIEEWEKIKFIDPANSVVSDEIRRAQIKIKEIEIANMHETEMKKQNESKANHLWLEGKYFFRQEDYNKAIEAWEKAILLVGRERRFIDEIEKTQSLMHKKKIEEDRKYTLNERRKKVLNHLIFKGNRLYNNGNFKEALHNWEKALSLDPDNVELKNGIFNAEERLKLKEGPNVDVVYDYDLSKKELNEAYLLDEEIEEDVVKNDNFMDDEIINEK